MIRASRWLGLVVLLASTARAHLIPVPPSACTFDPVELVAPDGTVEATAVPPGTADGLRLVYDLQASQAQFVAADVQARGFTAGAASGTIALPSLFVADMRNSGDLVATRVAVTLAMDGESQTTLATLTTGLATDGAAVVDGAPLAADGRFTLVGILPSGGPAAPLAGTPLVLRLTATAVPRPDTDQFTLATRTTPISAVVTAKSLSLRVIFAPGPTETPDFTAGPALFLASGGDVPLASAIVATGLQAKSQRLFIGRSADQRAALGVRLLRKKPEPTYLLAVKLREPAFPTTRAPVAARFTYEVGGLLSRATATLVPNRRGTRYHFH